VPPIQTGTFSKAFGAGIGGYVGGPRALIEHLRDQARFFIYTSGMPVAAVGAALAALRLMRSGDARLQRLRSNVRRLRAGLRELGYTTLGDGPIVPIMIGDADRARALGRKLFDAGIYIPAIGHPIVPEGTARLRAQLMATHEDGDIDKVLSVLDAARAQAPAS
jgi:glycine C-acetyltransferase